MEEDLIRNANRQRPQANGNAGRGDYLPGYPISPEIFTTVDRSVVSEPTGYCAASVKPSQVAAYEANGYGNWHYGPGSPHVRRLDIASASSANAVNQTRLLNFFAITDIHISDKESPDQVMFIGMNGGDPSLANILSSSYSPVMLYTTQVLDAAVQTINALHKRTPFDFGISLGDACNNTQHNELDWYITCLEGGTVVPSSGNHRGNTNIDYQKPFFAPGLDASIPWYQAVGNHDHFWIGSFPPGKVPFGANRSLTDMRPTFMGTTVVSGYDVTNASDTTAYYVGVVDGATPLGDIVGVGPCASMSAPLLPSGPDGSRESLPLDRWMKEFSGTAGSQPDGHGFCEPSAADGCYSFEIPLKKMPLKDAPGVLASSGGVVVKVIVLDDTQRDEDNTFALKGFGHGSLDKERFSWLCGQLDDGEQNGKLMIIAAHIPINVVASTSEDPDSSMGWWDGNPDFPADKFVSQAAMLTKLHSCSNLLLWIAGHRHFNTVTVQKATAEKTDDANREKSFWVVETASLRDFPQQFRMFEIVLNDDKTVSIFATCVHPAVAKGAPADISRTYSVAAYRIFGMDKQTGYDTCNVELVKQLSPSMQAALNWYGTPIRSLSSLTVDNAVLSPEFFPDMLQYSGTTTASSVCLTATRWYADTTSSIRMRFGDFADWVPVEPGHASAPIPLAFGCNTIHVEVTSGGEVRDYTVSLTRVEDPVYRLAGLTLSEGTLAPVFDPVRASYRVNVASTVSQLQLTAFSALQSSGVSAFVRVSPDNGKTWQTSASGRPLQINLPANMPNNQTTVLVELLGPAAGSGANAPINYAILVNRVMAPATVGASVSSPAFGNKAVFRALVDRNVDCVAFQFGTTPGYGSLTDWQEVGGRVWSNADDPDASTLKTSIAMSVEGLEKSTIYHMRVVAKTGGRMEYGEDKTFCTGPFTE